MSEEGGMFHWRDGLFFERQADGSVRIVKKHGEDTQIDVAIPALEWDSIVEAVSRETAALTPAAAPEGAGGGREDANPIPDDSLMAEVGRIGNEIHNLACEHQNNEDLAEQLEKLASRLWSLSQLLPTTPQPAQEADTPASEHGLPLMALFVERVDNDTTRGLFGDAPFEEARAALAAVRSSQWVPVSERLPEPIQFCDWLFPRSAYKHEYWILCNQALVTATTGGATHWRPAQPLPAAPQAEEVGK